LTADAVFPFQIPPVMSTVLAAANAGFL